MNSKQKIKILKQSLERQDYYKILVGFFANQCQQNNQEQVWDLLKEMNLKKSLHDQLVADIEFECIDKKELN